MIEWSKTEYGSCRSYDEVPEGAEVCTVNGRYVVAVCAGCGKVILWGQASYRDSDSNISWHRQCAESANVPTSHMFFFAKEDDQ